MKTLAYYALCLLGLEQQKDVPGFKNRSVSNLYEQTLQNLKQTKRECIIRILVQGVLFCRDTKTYSVIFLGIFREH